MKDRHLETSAGEDSALQHSALEWNSGDMPYSPQFGDHFYCQTDGRLECDHTFLAGNGLPARWSQQKDFRIGELGFGTGLNFCETWRQWKLFRQPDDKPGGRLEQDAKKWEPVFRKKSCDNKRLERRFDSTLTHNALEFVSFELYPMRRKDIDRALSRWPQIEAEHKALVAAWPEAPAGHVAIEADDRTRLTVICGVALEGVTTTSLAFDAWFLDGFAPARNPDMWSPELMRAIYDKTVAGGTFGTYAAAGFVRRNLVAAGFKVERRPGFAGKREMLCGRRE